LVAGVTGGGALRTFRVDKSTGTLQVADTENPPLTSPTTVVWVKR
jgi:hypothetical protein